MNTGRVRYILIILAIAGILFGCSSKPPKYGVVYFGYAKFSATEQGIEDDSYASWKEKNQLVAVVHFRSQGGKWMNLGFHLKGPDGEEQLPHYFKQKSDREWQIAFHPVRSILNPLLINQVAGDLNLYLLFPIKQKPSTSYVLTYSTKDQPEEQVFKILPGALDKEE